MEKKSKDTNLQFWRLQEYLSIHEAACLSVGVDPASFIPFQGTSPPTGYEPLYRSLSEDLIDYSLHFGIETEGDIFRNNNVQGPKDGLSAEDYKVTQKAIKQWLHKKELSPSFFSQKRIKKMMTQLFYMMN
jgi:hypothetical protein